jgi:hypothetical protein
MVQSSDIAGVLSSTEFVAKMKQKLKAAPEMEQRQAASEVKRKISSEAERTKETDKSDLLIISNRDREQEPGKKGQREKKLEEDEIDENEEKSDNKGLDVKA